MEQASKGFQCAGACEVDRYARQVYAKHWEEPEFSDITKVDAEEIPDHDILCAGFPCQAFSIAGRRLGFEDTRGTLFFEIARVAGQKRPGLLFLENVKGLLYHDRGKTFATILATLDELGYDAEWQVLNSKYFVPQNRERVFIIGHLRDKPTPKIFPITESFEKTARESIAYGTNEERIWYKIAGSLDANYHKGAGCRTMVAVPVLCAGRGAGRQHGRRFKTHGEPAFTLTQQGRHGIYDGVKVRQLTPLECERLQGFPDGWTDVDISDHQRYRCLGNAVTVSVIKYIAKRII